MKNETCEPCEWAGLEVPADNFVGWDQMPLCDYHYEIDRQGHLGNWINENVPRPEPEVVESGKINLQISTTQLMNELGFSEELPEDKVDALIFGSGDRFPLNYEPDVDADSISLTDDSLLDTLEGDAWFFLETSKEGSTTAYGVVKYLIDVLENHGRDVTVLITAFDNRYNG